MVISHHDCLRRPRLPPKHAFPLTIDRPISADTCRASTQPLTSTPAQLFWWIRSYCNLRNATILLEELLRSLLTSSLPCPLCINSTSIPGAARSTETHGHHGVTINYRIVTKRELDGCRVELIWVGQGLGLDRPWTIDNICCGSNRILSNKRVYCPRWLTLILEDRWSFSSYMAIDKSRSNLLF